MKPHAPICVVHIASGDLWAGAEVQLFTLAKTLHSFEKVTVRVILLNHGELENRLRALGIEVEVVDESQLNGLQIFWQLRKLLNSWQPDVVHTHRIKENILGGLAARLAGNIPSIRTVHGAPEHRQRWHTLHKRIYYILDWFIARYLQRRIIAVSDEMKQTLRKDFPLKKIQVIENGIDVDDTLLQAQYQANTPTHQGQFFKVGLVGRLVPVKRVDILIKAARYIQDHYPELEARFNIYGNGPLRKELEELCVELNVSEIVKFMGHCDNIHQMIKELDVLIMTSDHEGLPMILLEAMALKIPIISHATGGIPKLLSNGACGILSYNHIPADYAFKIQQLYYDTTKKLILVHNAFQQVKQNYSAVGNAEAYSNIYSELLYSLQKDK